MKPQKMLLEIPDDLKFSELKLSRSVETGEIEFEWEPIERICEVNRIDAGLFRDQTEDNVVGLIVAWYAKHRENDGEPNAIVEDLLLETWLEDARGGGFSHEPGRA